VNTENKIKTLCIRIAKILGKIGIGILVVFGAIVLRFLYYGRWAQYDPNGYVKDFSLTKLFFYLVLSLVGAVIFDFFFRGKKSKKISIIAVTVWWVIFFIACLPYVIFKS